jgi:hypothetical protein
MAVHIVTTDARSAGQAVRRINQRQLAARWGMSARTLERWRSLCQGPPFLKLGGRIAYQLEDVEAYEAARRQETNAG